MLCYVLVAFAKTDVFLFLEERGSREFFFGRGLEFGQRCAKVLSELLEIHPNGCYYNRKVLNGICARPIDNQLNPV